MSPENVACLTAFQVDICALANNHVIEWGYSGLEETLLTLKKAGDVFVASIHWGDNWGYEIPNEQREIAYRLIDDAGIDIIHGHSSHHVKGIEVYKTSLSFMVVAISSMIMKASVVMKASGPISA
ncbi:MAG: CapA family protein [Cyclobacteriaceae bacterium]|nr:CapA family protein [Cyclobacteriaceae bacterium]